MGNDKAEDFIADNPPDTEAVRKLRKADAQLAIQREANKLLRLKLEQSEQDLAAAEQRAEAMEYARTQVTPKRVAAGGRGKGGSAAAVLCLTDWHAEARVDPDTVGGRNAFDLSVFRNRLRRVWSKSLYLLDFARHISNIGSVVVWFGGDLIAGYIHEELQESNELSPSEAVLEVQEQMAGGLLALKEKAGLPIHVVTSNGNHGRTTKRMRHGTAYKNSWEWLAYNNVAKLLEGEKGITWQIGRGYHNVLEVEGRRVRFHHGDAIRYQGGVGGISIPVNKAVAQWNKSDRCELDIFGHWHQFQHHWNWVSCGCLVGYDAYAVSIKADYQPPTQTLVVVDRDRGKVLAMPIFAEEA